MRKILVIKTSSLGDIIHCFPAVRLLKDLNPNAELDWLVNKSFSDIVESHPDVNKIIPFDRSALSHPSSFFPAFWKLRNSLKMAKYDYAVDFQGLLRNSFFAWLSSSDIVAGFSDPKERISRFFYNKRIAASNTIHAVERNCMLVAKLFNADTQIPKVDIKSNEMSRKRVLELLSECGIGDECFVLVAPGARWSSKMWPADFFVDTMRLIEADFPNINFVLTGTLEDLGLCSQIESAGFRRTFNLAGKTKLRDLVELIRMGTAMICVDSGPMHIAAALDVPVFALFGPTDPSRTGPYGANHTVFQSTASCIKCFRKYCVRTSDKCHEEIKPEVFAETFKKNGKFKFK
jgi:lipopolysaccharide heptosyltransferase I